MASFDEFMDAARGSLFLPFACTFFSFVVSVIGKFKPEFKKVILIRNQSLKHFYEYQKEES
jgi:hypothetical protein